MIVGVAVAELHVHASQSLKEKRGVVRSVVQRVRNRFRATVSIAEVGGQDTWQRAQLGLATVGGDPRRVRALLESALEFIEGLGLAELMDSDIEILTLPHRDVSSVATDDEADEEEDPE